jgi:hypothetical protein
MLAGPPAGKERIKMKLIKMFGLAVIAALASMALVGASSASAESTVLCEEPEHTECSNPFTGHIEGLSTDALLSASFVHIECEHSVILGEALGLANPQVTHVTKLDFLNCEPCEPVVEDETGLIETLKTGLNLGTVKGSGFKVFVDCGIECYYGGTVEGAHAKGSEGGSLGVITANEVELERLSGSSIFCPSVSKWTATYSIVLPDELYIST